MNTDKKMVAVSRAVWEAHRELILKAGNELPISVFCKVCDQMKDDFAKKHGIPFGFQSNGRYEVYIQDVLKAGGEVSEEDLKSVKWSDIQFDWYEFDVLVKACAKVGNIVQDEGKINRDKALAWWNGLTVAKQTCLIEKHVKDSFDKGAMLSGRMNSYMALHIQEQEGA
jgi:hypothetical protein